jgi:hypothetical protein
VADAGGPTRPHQASSGSTAQTTPTPPGTYPHSATRDLHAENRKVGGSTPPLATLMTCEDTVLRAYWELPTSPSNPTPVGSAELRVQPGTCGCHAMSCHPVRRRAATYLGMPPSPELRRAGPADRPILASGPPFRGREAVSQILCRHTRTDDDPTVRRAALRSSARALSLRCGRLSPGELVVLRSRRPSKVTAKVFSGLSADGPACPAAAGGVQGTRHQVEVLHGRLLGGEVSSGPPRVGSGRSGTPPRGRCRADTRNSPAEDPHHQFGRPSRLVVPCGRRA